MKQKILNLLLVFFYVLITLIIVVAVSASLILKHYANALLIVSSLSVYFLGRHLQKTNKDE